MIQGPWGVVFTQMSLGGHWLVSVHWLGKHATPPSLVPVPPSAGHARNAHEQVPSDFTAQIGPPIEPSGQISFGARGCGSPHTHVPPSVVPVPPSSGVQEIFHAHWPCVFATHVCVVRKPFAQAIASIG